MFVIFLLFSWGLHFPCFRILPNWNILCIFALAAENFFQHSLQLQHNKCRTQSVSICWEFFKSVRPNLLLRMKSNWGTALAKRPSTSQDTRSEYLNIWKEESFCIHFTKIVLLFLFYRFSLFAEREREYTKHIYQKNFFVVKYIKTFVNIVAVERNQFIKVSSALACQHLGLMNNQNFCVHNTAAILQQLGLWFKNLTKKIYI